MKNQFAQINQKLKISTPGIFISFDMSMATTDDELNLLIDYFASIFRPSVVRFQSPMQYVRSNESSIFEFVHTPSEHTDIFMPVESAPFSGGHTAFNGSDRHSTINGSSKIFLKRRASER